jgi:8-oxo-dGTP diphosphatase
MALIRLAGGILWREQSGGSRLAVIHRPRQADWSLPKGRLDQGESWEEAALREVEEETACRGKIVSFAGAAIYVPRRAPRLVLYWHMALEEEGRFEPGKEVDELAWLDPGQAIDRLDHQGERRLLQRSAARLPGALAPAPTAHAVPEVAAARADVVRRLLAVGPRDEVAGLGPALDLFDLAEEAFARGATREGLALVSEARRMSLLSLGEPELSLRARALREEARALPPWPRRAIRRLLPADERPSPEAVYLAAELRDRGRELQARRTRLAPLVALAASAAVAAALWLAPQGAQGPALWAVLCGSLAGAAVAALFRWRSAP